MLANNSCILVHRNTGEVSVEFKIEHSKTGFSRYVNMVGTTKTSGVPVAAIVKELWGSMGLEMNTRTEGEYKILRPDYWVVRLSLLGIGATRLQLAKETMRRSHVPEVRELASCTSSYMDRRVTLLHDAEDKAYVNVIGGARGSQAVRRAHAELEAAGLGSFVTIVPGPLLRSTSGSRLLHEPFAVDSTYAQLKPIMMYSYEKANENPNDTDPERDLQGRMEPQFANHS